MRAGGTARADKSNKLALKTAGREESFGLKLGSSARVAMTTEETPVFSAPEPNEEEPRNTFGFSPPADPKLVASFRNPFLRGPDTHAAVFVGKPAPEIRLMSVGKESPLSSYCGKPVFIEFWATWCGPCADLIPELKKQYAETASKGPVWVHIDSDEDASASAASVQQEQVPWPNYHDDDRSLVQAFGRGAMPLGVLIDPVT